MYGERVVWSIGLEVLGYPPELVHTAVEANKVLKVLVEKFPVPPRE